LTCYIISYDRSGAGSYEPLYAELKSYRTWARITESTWAIVTDETAVEIRDKLRQYFPDGSRIFVVKSGAIAAWKNVRCKNDWLKEHL